MTAGGLWQLGPAYERYVGRWSRDVGHAFLQWLGLPAGLAWLDVGSGTGALSGAILSKCDPRALTGIDPSPGFLEFARGSVTDGRARFEQGDAQAVPLDTGAVDVAVCGLVLNFVPDPGRAVAEMRRVVRPGGTVALYVWDYAGEMQLMRRFWDAAAALDPGARELDESLRFPICKPEALAALFRAAGLEGIATRPIDIPTVFRDFDDYWGPFLGGQGPAPAYCMGLPEDRRAALRERLRASLPVEADGRIPLLARAFAARASVPEGAAARPEP